MGCDMNYHHDGIKRDETKKSNMEDTNTSIHRGFQRLLKHHRETESELEYLRALIKLAMRHGFLQPSSWSVTKPIDLAKIFAEEE